MRCKKIHKTIYLLFLISVPTANTLTLETIRLIHLTNFSGWIYRPLVSDKNTRSLEYLTHFSAVSQSNAEPQHRDIAAKEKLTGSPFMLCHCACYAEFEWHIDLDYWYALLSIFLFPETFSALISLAGGWLAKYCQSLVLYDVTSARQLPIFLCRAATNYRAQSQ